MSGLPMHTLLVQTEEEFQHLTEIEKQEAVVINPINFSLEQNILR